KDVPHLRPEHKELALAERLLGYSLQPQQSPQFDPYATQSQLAPYNPQNQHPPFSYNSQFQQHFFAPPQQQSLPQQFSQFTPTQHYQAQFPQSLPQHFPVTQAQQQPDVLVCTFPSRPTTSICTSIPFRPVVAGYKAAVEAVDEGARLKPLAVGLSAPIVIAEEMWIYYPHIWITGQGDAEMLRFEMAVNMAMQKKTLSSIGEFMCNKIKALFKQYVCQLGRRIPHSREEWWLSISMLMMPCVKLNCTGRDVEDTTMRRNLEQESKIATRINSNKS
ncbi:unnamed protein product, partial [Bodo saltans]